MLSLGFSPVISYGLPTGHVVVSKRNVSLPVFFGLLLSLSFSVFLSLSLSFCFLPPPSLSPGTATDEAPPDPVESLGQIGHGLKVSFKPEHVNKPTVNS